jgi:hypothetical protein
MAPNIAIFTESPDGSKAPFEGTGARVVVGHDTWIEIDFERNAPVPLVVRIGGRARHDRDAEVPRLRLDLHAGNVVSVLAHVTKPPPPADWEVLAVDDAAIQGRVLELLKTTHSGDPLGELSIVRDDRRRVAANAFVVDFGDSSTIRVELGRPPGALLSARIRADRTVMPKRGESHRGASMTIHPHACNLVSFWFDEVEFFRP